MIEQIIYHRLSGEIGEIVGSNAIHFAERPQKYPLPAVVVQRGSANTPMTTQGPLGVTRGFVRVTCLADTYLGAGDLARQVIDTLNGYRGTVTITTAAGNETFKIGSLILEDQTDITSDHRDGQGKIKTHGVQVDFKYQFKRVAQLPAE